LLEGCVTKCKWWGIHLTFAVYHYATHNTECTARHVIGWNLFSVTFILYNCIKNATIMQAIQFLKHHIYFGHVSYLRPISCMFQNLCSHLLVVWIIFCSTHWMAYKDTSLKFFILFPLFTLLCSKFQHRTINVEKS
jgi:hypothetical protein